MVGVMLSRFRISFPESPSEMCTARIRIQPLFLERGTASNLLTTLETCFPELSVKRVLEFLSTEDLAELTAAYFCFSADLASTNRRLKMEVGLWVTLAVGKALGRL